MNRLNQLGLINRINSGSSSGSSWTPQSPTSLMVRADSDTRAYLEWINNELLTIDGFKVYYSTDNATFTLKDTVADPLNENYIVTGLTANTLYYFKIAVYKGSVISALSAVASSTTLFNDADIWVDAKLSQLDDSIVNALEDKSVNNIDFAVSGTGLQYRSNGEYLCNKTDPSGLVATLPAGFQALSYAEFYFIVEPCFITSNKVLFSYRDGATELFQLIGTFQMQYRTSGNSLKAFGVAGNVKRTNIVQLIFDKPNSISRVLVDGTENTYAQNTGVETLRSAALYLMRIYSAGGGNDFGMKEVMCYFSNKLDATKRTTIYNYFNNKYNPVNNYFKQTAQTIVQMVAETPVLSDYFVAQDVYDLVTAGTIQQFDIETTDNPQTIFDAAPAGSLVRFKAGTHTHGLGLNYSILYVSKQMYIELEAGATLKLADNSNTLDTAGELVTNQGTQRTQEGFSYRGTYTGGTFKDLVVRIDGVGSPNTFKWGIGTWEPAYGHTGVAITGDWQALDEGLEIKFDFLTGYAVDNTWIVCFDGGETYGIRVGTGFHSKYIPDVKIFGAGIIDMNHVNQVPSSLHAKNLPSCILGHGRVKDIGIYSLTLQNCQRLIMLYGDNNSTYGFGGSITAEQTYDLLGAEIIDITGTNDWAPGANGAGGAGILLGHPEHRGKLRFVKCNLNTMANYFNGIECNFRLQNFEVRNNYIRGSEVATRDINRWRECMDGYILNNNASAAYVSAPTGWNLARNIYIGTNVRT